MKRGATISIVARAVALAACAAGAAAPAGAAPIFQFGTGSGSYTVLPGGRVEVPIFLQENSTAADPSIIEPEGGLFSVGLRVDPVAPQPGAASVLSPSDVAFNPSLTRTIHVDARYMIWVMDTLDHADHLVKEMGLQPRL